MRSPSRGLVLWTAAVVTLAILLAVFGSAALGRSALPSGSPSAPPSVAPSAPVATPVPSAPTDDDSVVIEDPTGHAITAVVGDRTDAVSAVSSGRPVVGMSVRWSDAIVQNVDDRAVRITWAGYPRDEAISVAVERDGAGFVVRITQGMPYPNTDAMGQDRILVVAFDEPVAAADVTVAVEAAAS